MMEVYYGGETNEMGAAILPYIANPQAVSLAQILKNQNDNMAVKKEQKMGFIKEYFVKHREIFMGLALAIVLDRYLLGGAFQERLKRIITTLLDKTESALRLEHK